MPQELDRPEVHQEVGCGIDDSGDDVEHGAVDAIIRMDVRIPIGSRWSRDSVNTSWRWYEMVGTYVH